MSDSAQRLDRWLWAARFFKTRQLANEAVRGGKVRTNGVRSKPAKVIKPGDRLTITRGAYTFEVRVDGLSERRVSAPQARALYTESDASKDHRARLALQLKSAATQIDYEHRRPTARVQRRLREFKRRT